MPVDEVTVSPELELSKDAESFYVRLGELALAEKGNEKRGLDVVRRFIEANKSKLADKKNWPAMKKAMLELLNRELNRVIDSDKGHSKQAFGSGSK